SSPPSTTRAASPTRFPPTRGCRCSTPTPPSSGTSSRRWPLPATTPSCTALSSAIAPQHLSSSMRSRPGSSLPRRSRTARPRSTMRRITDVLDCWFESGSMPYAQVHYPFENRQWFESHFPADFIVEYIGQTRGWFYTLHVLASALFDCPPFRTCLAHGIVLGDDGRKLSKRLKNFPDPEEIFATEGADAMRWALVSSPVLRGGDLVVDRRFISDAVRGVLRPAWNAWHFFTLYANTDGVQARWRTDAPGVLDRHALAKSRR